uniref:Secreted protein n=1 Tax=Globodera pallida TaxID=36090 RepID=A0A183CLM7_GLOPA
MRLSLVAGASVCITVKCVGGELLDLEPLDAKRLQAKNLHDYLQDIILAEKVQQHNTNYTNRSDSIREH